MATAKCSLPPVTELEPRGRGPRAREWGERGALTCAPCALHHITGEIGIDLGSGDKNRNWLVMDAAQRYRGKTRMVTPAKMVLLQILL